MSKIDVKGLNVNVGLFEKACFFRLSTSLLIVLVYYVTFGQEIDQTLHFSIS